MTTKYFTVQNKFVFCYLLFIYVTISSSCMLLFTYLLVISSLCNSTVTVLHTYLLIIVNKNHLLHKNNILQHEIH